MRDVPYNGVFSIREAHWVSARLMMIAMAMAMGWRQVPGAVVGGASETVVKVELERAYKNDLAKAAGESDETLDVSTRRGCRSAGAACAGAAGCGCGCGGCAEEKRRSWAVAIGHRCETRVRNRIARMMSAWCGVGEGRRVRASREARE